MTVFPLAMAAVAEMGEVDEIHSKEGNMLCLTYMYLLNLQNVFNCLQMVLR